MPELPEAETIARDLDGKVRGARIVSTRVLHDDILAPHLRAADLGGRVTGGRIDGVSRRGKNVVIALDGDVRVFINLGLTGRFITSDSPRAAELRHNAVRFGLEDGRTLIFDDARRFGRVDLLDSGAWATRTGALGVEPLSADFTLAYLRPATRASITPIRNWLLDQRRVAGVGNIYANEALFRAGIHPARAAGRISSRRLAVLVDSVREVLKDALRQGGTTLRDYVGSDGRPGYFKLSLNVYDREGVPCQTCGGPIRREVLGQRATYYCAGCQR
jgi:formamidopyrimidine-DNA glycosylase